MVWLPPGVSTQNPFSQLNPVSKEEAFKRWDHYGPIGFFKNESFTLILFPDPDKSPNARPYRGVLTNFLQTIKPYNDYKSGSVSISTKDGTFVDKAKGARYHYEKRIKFLVIFIVLVGGLVAYFTPVIKMELAESAQYTENDKREYNFYTPGLLKKMPRIAEQYDFHFANISGPADHIYSMAFYGTHDTVTLPIAYPVMATKKTEL